MPKSTNSLKKHNILQGIIVELRNGLIDAGLLLIPQLVESLISNLSTFRRLSAIAEKW
jgi:hypothetical protein